MEIKIENSWKNAMQSEFEKPYFENLVNYIKEEKSTHIIYPPGSQIFNAFTQTPFQNVKVVILGQDPYHGAGQAHGLCFSVVKGIVTPPSLQNIYKELLRDFGYPIPKHGELTSWAEQGVLLLNATLTVRANQAGSHQKQGWEVFTDAVIKTISEQKSSVVFMLWGNYARSKKQLIDSTKHLILEAPHPSPLSAHRGFIGCGHFSATNAFLQKQSIIPIDWKIQ